MDDKFLFSFDIFESFNEMCFLISKEGQILDCNTKLLLTLGIEKKAIVDKNFFTLIDKNNLEFVKEHFQNSLSIPDNTASTSKLKFNDKELLVHLSFIPIKNEHNATYRYLVFLKDITREKKKENELLRFYYVAENTVNPLQITDINGKMIYVNPAFVQTSGYTKEELLGNDPRVFSSKKHSKKFWTKMWDTIKIGKVWVGEVENKKKNGEPFYAQLLISPIIDEDGNVNGFFGVHRDLSEKKVLEKQLIHTQKMESIGTLAAGIAHEVGNPLASISAIVQVVQRQTTDEFVKEKLNLVKSQITRISKIIRDLVDFSRPSNYELKVTDINQNIKEAVEITKVGSKAKDIEFELELNKDIPLLPLIADQLQQIFVNILLNAVDAINEKEKKNKEKIVVKSDITEDDVVITFSDSGNGIPEENLVKVFEPFFTTKKEGKGTGLGLWVSYGIIKSFQGDVKVYSKLGKGTTFVINIPIQP